MKDLDLKEYGFQELNAVEIEKTNGGIIGWFVPLLVTYVFMDILMNPKSAWEEIEAGYNSY